MEYIVDRNDGLHYQPLHSNGCSDTVNVTIALDVARWTGAVSTNWHTAGNWNINRIPNDKTHVIIEANKPFNCIISTQCQCGQCTGETRSHVECHQQPYR